MVLLFGPFLCNAQIDCDSILRKSMDRWSQTTALRYVSEKKERSFGKYTTSSFRFTVQREPFKVAGKIEDNGKTHYVLYDSEISRKEVLYIPDGFPFTNLWLDVNGSTFRGDNHYTVSDAGSKFIFDILEREFELPKNVFHCTRKQGVGGEVIEIEAVTDKFHYFDYTGKPGETVLDVARKFGASAYLILERNAAVDAYTDDCSGVKLQVPSHYGQRVVVQISTEHWLPVLVELYDEKGLVERYTYTNFVVNPGLPEDFFTEDHLDDLE